MARRAVRVASFWAAAAAAIMVLASLPDPALGSRLLPGVLALEFAGEGPRAAAIVAAWDRLGTLDRAASSIALDFVLLVLYGIAFAAACLWASRVHLDGRLRNLGPTFAGGALAAAALDAIENGALLSFLGNPSPLSSWPAYATAAAYAKFALLLAVVAYSSSAAVTWLHQRTRTLFGRPDWLAVDRPAPDRLASGRVPPWRAEDWWPRAGRVGVSCSGGGIRSAAYNLGALQELQRSGTLRRAAYLTAVSGGSYIAGAWAILRSHSEPALVARDDAFDATSPEEDWLRNHSAYLAPSTRAAVWAVARYLLGVLANVAFVGLTLFVVARPLGWLVGSNVLHPGIGHTIGVTPAFSRPMWMAAGGAAAAAVTLAFVAVATRAVERVRLALLAAACGAAALGVALFVVLIALPWAIVHVPAVLADPSEYVPVAQAESGEPSDDSPRGRQDDRSDASTVGWLLQVTGISATAAAGLRALAARKGATLAMAVGRILPAVLAALATILIVAGGARAGPSGRAELFARAVGSELELWAAGSVVLWMFYLLTDQTAWSLHPFYKRRLSTAFALRRVRVASGRVVAQPVPYDTYLDISRFPGSRPGRGGPQLVVCAAANVSDHGLAPVGRRAFSYTFSSTEVGGPGVGWMRTPELEAALHSSGRREDVTMMAAIAISGAAVSPAMGKMREGRLGPLLALANIRLGAWLPSLRWVAALAPQGRPWKDLPRARYLLNELTGSYRFDDRFTYVTDGGHWENLGLVELLRRGCTEIYCFDASGDRVDTFSTLGEAIALARTELDVDIEIDPLQDAPETDDPPADTDARSGRLRRRRARRASEARRRDPRLASHDHWWGLVRYPNGVLGKLVVVKLAVTADTPWDVRAYAAKDRAFPTHPTSDQLFDHQKFEAYRALGQASCANALRSMRRPLPMFDVFARKAPSDGGLPLDRRDDVTLRLRQDQARVRPRA